MILNHDSCDRIENSHIREQEIGSNESMTSSYDLENYGIEDALQLTGKKVLDRSETIAGPRALPNFPVPLSELA